MRLEYKFERISNDPEEINRVLETDSAWGWQVVNLQVIDTKSVYQGNTYGVVTQYGAYSVTEMVHDRTTYANITYSRDVDEPRYQRWCELEEEYERTRILVQRKMKAINERCAAEGTKKAVRQAFLFLGLIVVLFFILALIMFVESKIIGNDSIDEHSVVLVISLIAIVLLVLAVVSLFSGRRYAKKIKEDDSEYKQLLLDIHNQINPRQKQLVEEGLNL